MPQPFSAQSSNNNAVPDLPPDLHVLEYVAYLLRRKWLVMSCVIISAATFVAASYVMPYTYTSQARLLPPDRMASAGLLNSLDASGALRILKEIENPSVDLIQNFIESRTMATIVLRDSAVHAFYKQNATDPLEALMESIVVQPGVYHIDIVARISTGWLSDATAKENARRLSQRVVTLCIATMDSLLTSHLQGDVHQHLLYAEADYQKRRAVLDSLEGVQEQFEQTNGIVQLKEQTTQAIIQLANLRSEELMAEADAAGLSTDFSALARRRKEATDRVVATRLAVDRFKSQPDFSIAFNELPEVSRAYANLLVKVRTLEPVVIYLQHEVEQAKIDDERRRSLITVIDAAVVPEVRSSPKRLPMLMLGIFTGVVLSILLIAMQAMFHSWQQKGRG